jgi:hypothetical protein
VYGTLLRALVCGVVAALAVTSCSAGGPSSSARPSPSRAEFAARADRICLETASHFDELPDPDGEGGAKPIGIGTFMRTWVTKLRTVEPPPALADDWHAALDLLVRAADKLDEAEAGDPEAQGIALWGLEARAQEHIDAMDVPFQACFVQ